MTVAVSGTLYVHRRKDMILLGEIHARKESTEERPYKACLYEPGARGFGQMVDSECFASVDEAIAYIEKNPHYPAPENDVVPCEGTGVRRIADLPGGYFIALPLADRSPPGSYISGCDRMPFICEGTNLVARIRKNKKSFSVVGPTRVRPRRHLIDILMAAILCSMPKNSSGHEKMVWREAAQTLPLRLAAGGHLSHIGDFQD